MTSAEQLPGFRRRYEVLAAAGLVTVQMEDDFHWMVVTIRHDGERVVDVAPVMHRWPWNTCPGAIARLIETFGGCHLDEVTARREKVQNCTHLHDLAVLAASHAHDRGLLVYDTFVSDAVDGERLLEINRDGVRVHSWIERSGLIVEPAEARGMALYAMRDWIAALPSAEKEAARLLQVSAVIAHGRPMNLQEGTRAAGLPANCYTLQPERIGHAVHRGGSIDFSVGVLKPLGKAVPGA